ncbi:MAG: ParB N-terminal domain-containing protein [Thermoplasmata archaeon]
MTLAIEFHLMPLERLKVHEEVVPERVAELVREIRRRGMVEEPILVARGSHVILNGHHRFAALRAIGAHRVPAWVVEYDDPAIQLERWYEGPPLTKREVVDRAIAGRPFTPKTTKHVVESPLPKRPTPLAQLIEAVAGAPKPRAPDGPPHARARRSASG